MKGPTILYEDEAVVVLDKPSGMIVYPDGRHDYPSLSAWLEKKYKEFYFVHRIDRETSGVLIIGKTLAAAEYLKKQFKQREVRKVYRAFVRGAFKDERGIIDRPIGSARGGMAPRSAKQPKGILREASTTYRVVEKGKDVSYIEAFPKTGRTHQIRAHFALIQHPILGDTLYSGKKENAMGFERLALHALSLKLMLPNKKEMTFTAPLPEDFLKAEQVLRD